MCYKENIWSGVGRHFYLLQIRFFDLIKPLMRLVKFNVIDRAYLRKVIRLVVKLTAACFCNHTKIKNTSITALAAGLSKL